MNTNFTQEYNNSIPVRITARIDAKYAPSINNYSSRSLVPIKSTASTKPNQTNTTKNTLFALFNIRSVRDKAMAMKD